MTSILLVEDDLVKAGEVRDALIDGGVGHSDVIHAVTAADAIAHLRQRRFDLMLLDVNLPRRLGEGPQRDGGLTILRELNRDAELHKPRYIVGITGFEDIISEFSDDFQNQLWTLIHYTPTSDLWKAQIATKLSYIRAINRSENFSDGITYGIDLAVVCALPAVELSAIRNLDCNWQSLRVPHDQTPYLSGIIKGRRGDLSVVAAAAPRMGMAAAAVLAGKIISTFRPRYMAMSGICAGRIGKANYGDVIVAEPTFDWGSGKIDTLDGMERFRPLPHQLDMDVDFLAEVQAVSNDVGVLARIKRDAAGGKPDTELRVHFGPMATGAVVVANSGTFENLLDNNRGVIGLEMEAYGIASACAGSSRPRPQFLIAKSVCDFADEQKDDDFQQYAAETSARYIYHVAQQVM